MKRYETKQFTSLPVSNFYQKKKKFFFFRQIDKYLTVNFQTLFKQTRKIQKASRKQEAKYKASENL